MKFLLTIILAAVWLFAFAGGKKAADTPAPPPVFSPEVIDAGEIQPMPTSTADDHSRGGSST